MVFCSITTVYDCAQTDTSCTTTRSALDDESLVCKAKDIALVKIGSIPIDAAQFRGSKNAFLTKASSIDKTGQNRILQWLRRRSLRSSRYSCNQRSCVWKIVSQPAVLVAPNKWQPLGTKAFQVSFPGWFPNWLVVSFGTTTLSAMPRGYSS